MITKIVDRMICQGILERDRRDEYVYALTIRVEKIITYTLLALICIWTHNILAGLTYAMAFKCIRQYSGGYHAKSLIGCLAGKIVKRDVTVIEQGWPPMCVGFLHQPKRPQSLRHKDDVEK